MNTKLKVAYNGGVLDIDFNDAGDGVYGVDFSLRKGVYLPISIVQKFAGMSALTRSAVVQQLRVTIENYLDSCRTNKVAFELTRLNTLPPIQESKSKRYKKGSNCGRLELRMYSTEPISLPTYAPRFNAVLRAVLGMIRHAVTE